jgi:hypothetical protein
MHGPMINPRWPGIAERLRLVDRYIERVQAIDHRFETGKVGVVVDKESQRAGHMPEGTSSLRHHTELDFTGEIERRREDIRNDRGNLAKCVRKRRDAHTSINEGEIIGDQRPEALPNHISLCGFAVQKRHLLGIFGSAAARLMRAYATQVEVLRRWCNGGQQFMRIEHVHVNDGDQAVIGNVQQQDTRGVC